MNKLEEWLQENGAKLLHEVTNGPVTYKMYRVGKMQFLVQEFNKGFDLYVPLCSQLDVDTNLQALDLYVAGKLTQDVTPNGTVLNKN
jgi:hypothetical protein